MQRRNSIAGAAVLDTLTVRELTAGFVGTEPDDNAEHQIHGILRLTGSPDTLVLDVAEHARVMGLLTASRLAVGLTSAPDPSADDPYPASPHDAADPYPDVYGEGASPPERTGLTVDAGGNVRASGFLLTKQVPDGVVLRAPNGEYYSFVVDSAGLLSTVGRLIGPTPP